MKLSLILLSLLLLGSCTRYSYNVTYEKCTGGTGTYLYEGWDSQDPHIANNGLSVPELRRGNSIQTSVLNVCDFSYTKTPITE